MRRTRKHIKEGGGGSTESEDAAASAAAGMKETSKKKRRKGQTNRKDSKGIAAESKREDGQDSKGSGFSTVTEKCEDQASPDRQEQRATSNATALQTEQTRANRTNKVLGEHRLNLKREQRNRGD